MDAVAIAYDAKLRGRILVAIQKAITETFAQHDWTELGYTIGHPDYISGHKRLLRSLGFGDDDYGACVFEFLNYLVQRDPEAIWQVAQHSKIKNYMERHSLGVLSEMGLSDAHVPAVVPSPLSASDVVRRALSDADNLLKTNGATSAIDRVHTALHGYLRSVCVDTGIAAAPDASVTALVKALKAQHPALQNLGAHQAEMTKVLNSMSNIVDAVNTLWNHASVAHANEQLLPEEEALLVVNSVRALFNYLVRKFS